MSYHRIVSHNPITAGVWQTVFNSNDCEVDKGVFGCRDPVLLGIASDGSLG
jgi:hypothetical protein